jgi:alpha-L-rhamnosidase
MIKKFLLLCLFLTASVLSALSLTVDNLRVQSLRNPSGIDVQAPQFSWVLQSDGRGVVQTSYQLVVTTDAAGSDVVFDSGVVESSESSHVKVSGIPLEGAKRYYWHVTVTDNKGNTATSDEPAFFETGLMQLGWSGAKWIKASDVKAGEVGNEVTDYTVEGKD